MLPISLLSPEHLRTPLPGIYTPIGGADTGTYSCQLIAVADDETNLYFLEEFPNYRYVSGEIELLDGTASSYRQSYVAAWMQYFPAHPCFAWCDPNTQFRSEYQADGITLRGNSRGLVQRTEAGRVAFQLGKVWLAPWLTVLPYELEIAQWPDEHSTTGRYQRLKVKDHTLDCFEHICSRYPRGKAQAQAKQETFKQRFLREHGRHLPPKRDPHLGRL